MHHFLFRSYFRARAEYCGASSRATAAPPTSPLTSLLSSRDRGDARTTPPGLRRAHPCPCAPLTAGKLSPELSHQPSRHHARYLKSRQARRRFSSAPLLPLLATPPPPARPAPRRVRSRSPSGGVRWRRWSGPRGSGLSGWAGRSRVASCSGVLPIRRGAWRT